MKKKLTTKQLIDWLTKNVEKPCFEASEFALQFNTPQEAWEKCERGDWLLWIYSRLPGMDHPLLVKCACKCARRSLKFITNGDKRPLEAIEAGERWADDPTEKNRASAYSLASAYASASAYSLASASASASASAYSLASVSASASASDYAYASASASAYASFDTAKTKEQKAQAKLIRRLIPSIENLLAGIKV